MWLILIAIFVTMLLAGVWIAVVLGLTGIIVLYLGGGLSALQAGAIATWAAMYNYPLAALPMYIFLGEVFVASGLAHRSYDAISPLLERAPGKLLVSNVVLDTMFGAVVGSSMATAACVGSIAYPELSKRGYNRTALVGNLAGAGTLGSFVPPSLPLILYGAWVEVSVGACFAAALIPALITAGLFMIYLAVACRVRPDIAPAGKLIPLLDALKASKAVWPLLILMGSIMGAIYFGIATAVEAAGLGACIAVVMSFCFKTFSFGRLHQSLSAAVKTCGQLLLVISGAMIFSISLSSIGIPRQVVLAVEAMNLSPLVVVMSIYLLYLVLGCFFNFIGMMVMTIPFTFPLMMSVGVDPYWFGVVLVVLCEMGLLTPPVGLNLFILQGVTNNEVSLGEVAKGSIPYFLMLGVTLMLITIFPQLCTWLPAHMR